VVEKVLFDLSEASVTWAVMKNHQELPDVRGDIDLCVARRDWERLTRQILTSLSALGSFSAVYCDHFTGVRLMFIAPSVGTPPGSKALEIDFGDGAWWKGTRLCSAADVLSAFADRSSEAWIPHTQLGFQAALTLTVSAIRRGGTLDLERIRRKSVSVYAGSDPDGFLRAMRLFHGPAGERAARAFLDQRWRASDGALLILGRMRRSIVPYHRIRSFVGRKIMWHWRGLPRVIDRPTQEWLASVSAGHGTYDLIGPSPDAQAK
jgi:hypothetical protein